MSKMKNVRHDRIVEFEYEGESFWAYCPAAATYDIYEHFGASGSIEEISGYLERTRDGWDACCWILAEFCRWGEIMRRQQGFERRPLMTVGRLQLADAWTSERLRETVTETIRAGFERFVSSPEPDEVNLVLLELDKERKKAPPRGIFGRIISRRAPDC